MSQIIREDIERILAENLSWESFRDTNVLVTGASGMIGSYFLYVLNSLNESYDYNIGVYALVRNPNKLPSNLAGKINVIKQSVTESIDVETSFDYIIHAASPASPSIMKTDPVGTWSANVLGTYNTLELARKNKSNGYLYISSREIYGQPYEGQEKFTEEIYGLVDPLDVRSCYPEGKKAAENLCVCYKQQYGINAKIARLAHTFGPGMSINDGRVQADFLRNVVRHENIVLKSKGESVRTYTYVADAVSAMFRIILSSENIVYNIASEESTVSILALANTLAEIYKNRGVEVIFDIPTSDTNSGTAPFTLGILDSSSLRGIGWKPAYTLQEGLIRTVKHLERYKERA